MTPEASIGVAGRKDIAARNRMIGAIIGSVVMVGLVLSGFIFCLRRRRMSKKSSLHRVVDATRLMPNVSLHSSSPQTKGQREGGIITRDRNSFFDRNSTATRNSTLSAAAVQIQRSPLDRCSQISATSSISRSIRFVVTGDYRSPANSHSSRATMPATPSDVARTLAIDPFAGLAQPRSPVRAETPTDHSATWRGTNLSNIIKAARGIKG